MGFATSRAALRYGFESTRAWLDAEGAGLARRLAGLGPVPQPTRLQTALGPLIAFRRPRAA